MTEWIPLLQTLVWPIFITIFIFFARPQIVQILKSIATRIERGDPFQAGPSGLSLGSSEPKLTYAHTGNMLDALVFFIYVALSALGVFKSPYYLAAAWLLFIPWSFLPHELTKMHPDFAIACVIYCLPIGLYLLWGSRIRRWEA